MANKNRANKSAVLWCGIAGVLSLTFLVVRTGGGDPQILVLSGKGGVGKSTVSCQLAFSLASQGHTVGLLDVDICGPSVPRMLGLTGREVHQSGNGWTPILVDLN